MAKLVSEESFAAALCLGAVAETEIIKTPPDFDPNVINVWSGPRCLSTSLMYSFAQRDDTQVLDEPLYAHFLHVTGAQRPYRDQVLASMDTDGDRVVRNVIYGPRTKAVLFAKHMAKQRTPGLTREVLLRGKNVLLIRDPMELLPSFHAVVSVSLEETGLPDMINVYSESRRLGRTPPVVDATLLRKDPEGVLRALCAALDIGFQESMLSWTPGPRAEDGLWAPWWYTDTHKSSGFAPPLQLPKPFPMDLYPLLEECRPLYNLLRRDALLPLTAGQPLTPTLPVPRNERLLVWVGDGLVTRDEAKVSVFDSAVQGGDGVWEGLRIYQGRIFKLEEHLARLQDSAHAMAFSEIPSNDTIKAAIFATLAANGMRDQAHIRLTLTRGKKVTSGMSPHFNQYGPTLIVLAEWKPPVYDNSGGIRLVTSATRRNSPQCVDSKIHHTNLINNILAKVEGNNAGADDAVMLDCDGFVAETNATNIFIVKRGRVLTPTADYCLPGITRSTVMSLSVSEGLPLDERRVSLSELHSADEIFTTGTMGELSPVVEIDGRRIGEGQPGPVTRQLQVAYARLTATEGVNLPQ